MKNDLVMACLVVVFGVLGFVCQVSCSSNRTKYENHALVRLYPKNVTQLESIQLFYSSDAGVDVLKPCRGINESLDLLVPPERVRYVEESAAAHELFYEITDKDYSRKLAQNVHISRKRFDGNNPVFRYISYSDMQDYIESVALMHPELVTLQPLGESYEGRKMKLVKISKNCGSNNPVIFIDAGIHAREWVAGSMALYLIYRLTNYPEALNEELNGVDWYILPNVNPDGYEYSRANNRMWRKTRSRSSSHCFGVDGNRNYGYKWAVSGVSHDPCDKETYAGPHPFSEPETRIVKGIMHNNQHKIKLYVSLHSYGQYLVYPWGYTGGKLPKQWETLHALASKVSEAVVRAGGLPFKVLSAGKWYPAAGASDDYAFGGVGIPYSYTMELTDGHEFVFPEELLREVLPQFYEGFKVFSREIKIKFRNRA